MLPPRTPWRAHFPTVVLHSTLVLRDGHRHYEAAKSGDPEAALSLAQDLLDLRAADALKEIVGERQAILLPITALETTGFNAIPDAMAQILGGMLSLPVRAGEIVQANRVGHTRARAFNRLVTPAAFEGAVEAGASYVLVDDHVGLVD